MTWRKYSLNINSIIFLIIILIAGGLLIGFIVSKYVRRNLETKISTKMISSGLMLILGAFPRIQIQIIGLVSDFREILETNYTMIACGIVLIFAGLYYEFNIREKIYILNMLGIPVQREISDEKNIHALKLADYKVKEYVIDMFGIYDNEMDEKRNKIIVQKIKKCTETFCNRSKEFRAGFTGMAPIPYTIYAGLYLANGDVRRYFEYKRQESKYYELRKKKKRRDRISDIEILKKENPDKQTKEIVLALSVTRNIQNSDLIQFEQMDTIHIYTKETKDNLITSLEQLDKYAVFINQEIEALKQIYPNLNVVHLVAAIPSCLSLELGKLFALNSHRLPRVISYHYVSTGNVKYPFGIVVSDGEERYRGKLIKG